jgi:hypothetical protein
MRSWSCALSLVVILGGGLGAAAARADDAMPAASAVAGQERSFCESKLHGELWERTELYFGLSRADGPAITDEEFQHFLDTEVTPRFPDGLTLLSGNGQFRGASGEVVQEGSKLLILLYPWSNRQSRAADEIRDRYKDAFHQESVLRVDEQSCVSF